MIILTFLINLFKILQIAVKKCLKGIYKEVNNAIKYGRETLILDIVIDSFKSKEIEIETERVKRKSGEIHLMRVRLQSRTRGVEVAVDKIVMVKKRVEVSLSHKKRQRGLSIMIVGN